MFPFDKPLDQTTEADLVLLVQFRCPARCSTAAIGEGLHAVSAAAAHGLFKHCGYVS